MILAIKVKERMPAVSFSLKTLILIIQYVFKDLGILCIYSVYETGIFYKLLLLLGIL